MNPGAKSFSSQGSVSASVDSLASVPGIRETTLALTPGTGNELLLAQGSPNSLNSTSASSLSSAGSLPIHQHHLQNPMGESVLGLTFRSHNVDGGLHSMSPNSRTQSRTHTRNHSRTQSSNSHHSLAMNSRTPSESNGQYTLYAHQANSTAHTLINDGSLAGAAGDLGPAGRPSANVTPQAHPTLIAESHGSNYLSSPNDVANGGQGEAESPIGDTPSNWNSPPSRPQIPPIVSTSMTSSTGGLTSPASLSSPVQLTQPSPSSQHIQTTPLQQQSAATQQQFQPAQKPKKEKHSFGGMSASSFLTETLPGAGMKLYPGSKRGAKSHGDMSISSGKNKKSGGSTGSGGGGPLSSINTRKHQQQQLSPGAHSSIMDRTYSSSSNISSPMTGSGHYMTSPTMSRNNHSSLDAKVMAREMSQGHATEDVWQALCIKVLTLFNGQGLTGAIEDLNELVRRSLTTRNAFTLCDEINELLKNGMLTLNAKLGDVPDEKLVSRLVEGWSFFFGTVLPYFEGVFLPLQIELKTYHAKKMTRKIPGVASSAASHHSGNNSMMDIGGGGGSGLMGASPRSGLVDLDRNNGDSEPENVRTMALAAFRDQVILPMVDRLDEVFAKLFVDLDASISVSDTALRMIQMTSVLTSIQSGDAQQLLMEQVYNRLKTNWKQFTRRGNRGGFIGLDKKIGGMS
ncbi:HbrB-domain-containing protein [Linnemannia elongata AG-77]|uniref:HbrB-domain-containing protein n=1 Tax=Linnemannia elongata AG-77 TaxID=1314771 RepID=A0A197K427_9FUNG|nr:HbrB-domain-containing protein [Linnemannia elongata AG-77]